MTKTIHVEYFALLREQRGLSAETVSTSAVTVADFYAELQKRHPFTLPTDRLRAALNGEFAAWNTPLEEGARIVFIPPVAGG